MGSVRAAPKLFGHRGAAPVDVEALYDVVARVACMADELAGLDCLELNPVVVGERGVAVLAATLRIAPDPGRTDAGVRQLTSSP